MRQWVWRVRIALLVKSVLDSRSLERTNVNENFYGKYDEYYPLRRTIHDDG
jgi:hypothetical protein